ncbi:MAG: hypothetical protein ABFD97_23390 [Syntrophobacter sp.]
MQSGKSIRLKLALIRMGPLTDLETSVVAANIQAVLGINVYTHNSVNVPEEAFQENRLQYDAGLVLKYLSRYLRPDYSHILGITHVDLCTPILTHVYGQAELGGRIAVISNARLLKDTDTTAALPSRYYERLAKVALHEVAHTFSLYHCDTERCLMRFSSGLKQLDHLDIWFCGRCEFILHRTLANSRG